MKTRYIAAVGVLSLAVTGLVAARSQGSPDTTTAAINSPANASSIAGPGRIEARSEEIDVAPEVSGKIAALLIDEGDVVAKGAVLARLEQRDYVARVAAAAARLKVAEADLRRLVNGARAEERREASAVADEASAQLEHARTEVARARRLYAADAIARQTVDAAERDLNVATAKKSAALERSAFVSAEARDDERERAEAAVQLARAALEEARAMLAKTEVRAPIDATVLRRHKLAGESVSLDGPSTAIVTLADLSVLHVRMEVDERDVAVVHVGQKAWVSAAAYGAKQFHGHVIRISPMLGRKKVRTDEPAERIDTKVMEAVVELDRGAVLPIGLRVDAFLQLVDKTVASVAR